jgi:aminoglycoside phosphotransferase (APT) family kinase protein
MMLQIVRNKLAEIVGEIHIDEVLSEQGWTSQVRKLVTSEGTYLLKSSYKERYRSWLKTEAQVLQRLSSEPKIPVPKYYGFVDSEEGSHLLMSFEEGITLTSALKKAESQEEREALLTSFGQFLQRFHEMIPNEKLVVKGKDWLERQLERAQVYVNRGQAEGDQGLLDTLIGNKPSQVKQTMIHGDCTTDNVLVLDGKVHRFIDVAGMTVGDPRYDEALAIRKIIKQPDDLKAFYKGYTRNRITQDEFHYFEDGLYAFF